MRTETLRVLYVTNLPSPYRTEYLNELGKKCDLTVLFERETASDRDPTWRGTKARNYREIYCSDRSLGADKSIGFDLCRQIRDRTFDRLLFSGYSSPAVMAAILDCQKRGVPYYMQYDGGFDGHQFFKDIIKRRLLRPAVGHFTSCTVHRNYLISMGIPEEKIWIYPFTSLTEDDILTQPPTQAERTALRAELGVTHARVVIAVGRFIRLKGFDILLNAAALETDPNVGFYFIGGEATEEYLSLKKSLRLSNVQFIGFQSQTQLRKWYQAADVFVLPTRSDKWGLVVNEALANALPVITTTACCAGMELIRDGENGFTIPPEDPSMLFQMIECIMNGPIQEMKHNALLSIQQYTISKMANEHFLRLSQQ